MSPARIAIGIAALCLTLLAALLKLATLPTLATLSRRFVLRNNLPTSFLPLPRREACDSPRRGPAPFLLLSLPSLICAEKE